MTEVLPWVKWWFDRWRSDEGLRVCSLAARGLWIEMLSIMHGCEPYGHLAIRGKPPSVKQLASLVGMSSDKEVSSLLEQLEEAGVFSRSDDGLIYSRRMVRDQRTRDKNQENGRKGGNPSLKAPVNPPVNPELQVGLTPLVKADKRREDSEDRRVPPVAPLKRGTKRLFPEDWEVTGEFLRFGETLGLTASDVHAASDRMADWAKAGAERKVDWDATFRNWLRKDAADRRKPRHDPNPMATLRKEWGLGTFLAPQIDDDEDEPQQELLK